MNTRENDKRLRKALLGVVQNLLSICDEFLATSSSSSDDDELVLEELHKRIKRRRTSAECSAIAEVVEVSEIRSFVEYTVPRFSDNEFQSHFRLSIDAFEWLLAKVDTDLQSKRFAGRQTVDTRKQLLAFLWLFATSDSFRSVGSRFDLPKGTLHACFIRVLHALNCLGPAVITWPDADRRKVISTNLKRLGGLKGVVGIVDSTYIRVKAPSNSDRNISYGITLQGICDDECQFTDCFAGYPTSVADTRIFRQSDIYKAFVSNRSDYFSPKEYIIGDEDYEIKPFCVSPYNKSGVYARWHSEFNQRHAQTRKVIERTFGLFFGRFRRFRDLDMSKTDHIPATIIAACVLHNICLTQPSDVLGAQFEEEGIQFLRDRSTSDDGVAHAVVTTFLPADDEGTEFRDQLAREMGLLTDEATPAENVKSSAPKSRGTITLSIPESIRLSLSKA